MPPPTHIVTMPYRAFRRFISWSSWPSAWRPCTPADGPSAIAPPLTLTFAGSSPSTFITASDCAAKASFSSIRSIWSSVRPASFSAFGIAYTGPTPISSGRHPAYAYATKRASGRRPSAFARSSEITTAAAAPSDVCDELPAVTVPLAWKAGFNFASASIDVSARGPSSALNSISVFFGFDFASGAVKVTGTGTISCSNCPAACAASAF